MADYGTFHKIPYIYSYLHISLDVMERFTKRREEASGYWDAHQVVNTREHEVQPDPAHSGQNREQVAL
jgi:hypothetical protein